MDFRIKNIVKTISFLFCLVLPFWISRIWLFLTNDDLFINDLASYVICLVRFDLKTLTIWYAPLFICLGIGLFLQKIGWRYFTQFVFSSLFLFALVFNLIAVLYLPVSKVIVGPELFQLVSGQSPVIIWGYIIENWYFIILVIVVTFLVNKIFQNLRLDISRKSGLVLSFFTFFLIGFFARGGVALKPLNLMDAYAELTSDEVTHAVTPIYFLLESYGKQNIQYEAYFSDDILREKLSEDAKTYGELPVQNPNICLILLESFGQEYTRLNKSNRPSYTPFLDSLMSRSLNFTNAYANGLRSIDAVASCIAGIPCLSKQPFIGSLYTQSDINTIPKALKKVGYTTSFFHGADELSMGFKPYLQSQGIDNYYAKQDYPDIADFDGTWGIYDEPFLAYCGSKLSSQNQPWFSGIFTLSSHHPYRIPEKYVYLPKGTSDIHQSIGYTDHALRKFFDSIQSENWYKNTIFIITADHSSINESRAYQSYRGKYAVPLFIYAPKWVDRRDEPRVVQHIDIFTTIKHLASTGNHFAFGTSLLGDSSSHGIAHFDGNIYTYTTDSLTIEWNGDQHVRLFNYKSDPTHLIDMSVQMPEAVEMMLQKLKMYIQKYNYRLLNNNFKNQ